VSKGKKRFNRRMAEIRLIELSNELEDELMESLASCGLKAEPLRPEVEIKDLISERTELDFVFGKVSEELKGLLGQLKDEASKSLRIILSPHREVMSAEDAFDIGASGTFVAPHDAFRISKSIQSLCALRDSGRAMRAPRYLRLKLDGKELAKGDLMNLARGGFFGLVQGWAGDLNKDYEFEIETETFMPIKGHCQLRWLKSGLGQFEGQNHESSTADADVGLGFAFKEIEERSKEHLKLFIFELQDRIIYPVS